MFACSLTLVPVAVAPLAAIKAARVALGDVKAGMDLTAEQAAQISAAEKTNSLCIKLGAMVGSKKSNKQDIFSAAKGLTDLLGEMSALLGLAQDDGECVRAWACFDPVRLKMGVMRNRNGA